ncbi:DNA polymerase I [Tumebacillus flagellatus]|uniref:DNA polymerase I n=1 Tax=Tumebacillus flagellatus TaxID=1157490 RepID=A0A074LQF3_9BACL|nr:DNA polymerase I [Tumebacillus flagellatus]KEO82058.1 DNA polymerase I [Tumebacillus flagellatus]
MSQEKKLILIDGNSITYRAFFALPPLSNSKGQFTNAAFGFTQMLLRLLQDEKPTHLVVAFDKGKANFRHEVFSEYKGTREKTPGELREQFPIVREILQSFDIPYVEIDGYEADDIIGTLTKQAEAEGYDSLVVTGDKDLLQIVSDHVTTMLTRKGITETEKYGIPQVHERYGLTPQQIIDLKGLMGDTSDNIPGIPGVGEKTALKLLAQYPSVEEVLAHADEAPGKKLQEKLKEHADSALLSKKLATILREAPLGDVDLESYAFSGYDAGKVRDKFKALEFKSLLDRLPAGGAESESDEPAVQAQPLVEAEVITEERVGQVLAELPSEVGVWLDLTGNYQLGDLHGIAFATKEKAWYLPLAEADGAGTSVEPSTDRTGEVRSIIPTAVRDFLANTDKQLVFFDLKAALVALRSHGVELNCKAFCTLLGSYLLNPSDGAPDLYDIIDRHVGWKLSALPTGTAKKKIEVSTADRAAHAGAAAAANALMQDRLVEALRDKELLPLYQDLELPLTYVLAGMEAVGVRIDTDELRAIGDDLKQRIELLQAEIWELAGEEFNLNSPKQLGEILFEKLGLKGSKKTKTGYSTAADVLEKLAPFSPVVAKILEFRHLGKLNSTYVEGLLNAARQQGESHYRVHTQFNQALTATGRLSSTEPNLQNIPIRTEEGRRLRHVFVPSKPGWKILAADYSQIELRILADIAGDENMIDAFVKDMDIHTRTASDVFEVAPEEVDANMRRAAKAVNFGIVYGISDFGLSQNLNISRKDAGQFIENYFAKFSGVKRWMDEIVEQARQDGYVKTKLGRIRQLPDINASNFNVRSFAERTAMNTPIQGTAADIIKKAMVSVDEALKREQLSATMLLQVHDELIFEVPEEEIEALSALVRREMESVLPDLKVPLKADLNVGDTWYEAK